MSFSDEMKLAQQQQQQGINTSQSTTTINISASPSQDVYLGTGASVQFGAGRLVSESATATDDTSS